VLRDEIAKTDIGSFARRYGLPGFSSTQGHIASAVPWLPHALAAFEAGTLHRTMLMAKGSLFLGRLTRQWDGVSVVIER
jgi:betaine reductase